MDRPRTAPVAAPTRAGSLREALIRQGALLLILAILAAPASTSLAPYVRWAFPGAAALVAGWLALRQRSATYLTFCLWLFVLTPFVRRLVDGHAGFAQVNVLMLAPYLALGWTGLQAPRFFLTPGRPGQWPVAVLMATVIYGFLLALAQGNLFPGALDLLRWTMPPLIACYIIARSRDWEQICLELRAWALLALPLVSVYGLYQFVAPPYWDAIWMLNSRMNSIGEPHPFEIRVFGTMNSPASFAYWLEALILISMTMRSPLRWPNVGLGVAAIAVTLVRSAWLGLAVGLLLLAARAPRRVRTSVLLMLLAGVFAAPLALTNAKVEKAVVDRIETLTNVSHDHSYDERMAAYADSIQDIYNTPWGIGIGTANVAANYTENKNVIDGGPIEICSSLGVFSGFLYILMILSLLIRAIVWPVPNANQDLFVASVTIVIAQALALSSVTTTVGEIGVLFWLALGLVLGSPRAWQYRGRTRPGRFPSE